MPTTYSHSRLAAYETCPLKYKYTYIDRLDRERRDSIEAFMGSLVHETMEKLYHDLTYTKVNTLDELAAFYHDRWEKTWREEILIVRKEYTPAHYRSVGERCIRDYYARYQPFAQSRTLGIERHVAVNLPDGSRLAGYIDRLAQQPDGTYEIHDYKTSGHLPGQSDLDHDRQLALYQIGIQQEFRDAKRVQLVWHYLAFDKSLVSQRDAVQLGRLQETTVALIREIESAKSFPPRENALCRWCEFQDICPVWKHPAKLRELAPHALTKDSGVQLVNQLVKLKDEKRRVEESVGAQLDAIEARITETEAQLIELAKQEGMEIVQGSQHKARVKLDVRWKVPGKDEPARRVLEGVLQQAGKWAEVSTLDGHALNDLLSDEPPGSELLARITGLVTRDESARVFLSKGRIKER